MSNPINPPTAHADTTGTFNPNLVATNLIVRNGTITDQQKKDAGVDFYGTHFTPIDKQSMMERQRIATIQRENERVDDEVSRILNPAPIAVPPPPIRRQRTRGGIPDFNLFDFD